MSYTRQGAVPYLSCVHASTDVDDCSYRMFVYLKEEINNFDVVSLGEIHRQPFTVLSPHIVPMVSIIV